MLLKLYVLSATLFLSVCADQKNLTSNCGREEKFLFYMDMAMEMMTKAKNNWVSSNSADSRSFKVIDCEELQKLGYLNSGIYTIWPMSRVLNGSPIDVYCDMHTDGGGWTVIQRRGNYGFPKDYFFRQWASYKFGFGELNKEFWLGNDNIFALTSQKLYSVRFDLKDITGETRYALYDKFWIDDEAHLYTLHIQEYSGNAGDSMLLRHDNKAFSTKDRDNDSHKDNCPQIYKGAWWYGDCYDSNLNGFLVFGKQDNHEGVNWRSWKGVNESLLSTEIKIRSKNFKKALLIAENKANFMFPKT